MKKFFTNKKTALVVSAALLALVTVGTTLALIITNTGSLENKFTPSKVACAVVEDGGDPVTGNVVNTGTEKKNVTIKNTGDTDALIRAAIVVNWATADGSKIWAQKPVLDKDYIISLSTEDQDTCWEEGSDDGYYYYTPVVATGASTGVLIKSASLKNGAKPPVGPDGTEYYLSIEIVASAIQSNSTWGQEVTTAGGNG